MGEIFFYYMFKTNLSGHNKIWGDTKNLGRSVLDFSPGYGPEL